MIWPIVWKEWRQQGWKMVFGTVMLLCFGGALMVSRATSDKETVSLICFLGGMVLALYSAMGVFAGETSNGTTVFLKSKPVAPWKVFLCKWFFGWLNFVVPLVVSFFCLRALDASWFGLFGRTLFVSIAVTTMFYTMTCCLAPAKSSEAVVGLAGLAVIGVYFIYTVLVNSILPDQILKSQGVVFGLVAFVNPFMWIAFLCSEISGQLSILFIEQGLLFLFVMWVGLRKWERGV